MVLRTRIRRVALMLSGGRRRWSLWKEILPEGKALMMAFMMDGGEWCS